jgi:hypothetical protein
MKRNFRIEVIAGCLVAVSAYLFIAYLSALFPDSIYGVYDIWFEADQPRVLNNMTDWTSDHYRTKVHPIFSLLMLPPTKFLMALGVPGLTSAKTTISLAGTVCALAVYLSARVIGLTILDSILVFFAFLSSACVMFWFGLVETYAAGAMTISLMLLVAAKNPSTWIWIAASAGTLAVTITNWSLGLLTSYFVNRSKFVVINSRALGIVVIGAIVQKLFAPSAELFFMPNALSEEIKYVALGDLSTVGWRIVGCWLFSAVAPLPYPQWNDQALMWWVSFQSANLSSLGAIGSIALLSWIAMLLLGAIGMIRTKSMYTVSSATILFLLLQTLLHSVYGDYPFLYSAHLLPAFMFLCALGFLGLPSIFSRAAFAIFILSGGISNYSALQSSLSLTTQLLKMGHPPPTSSSGDHAEFAPASHRRAFPVGQY